MFHTLAVNAVDAVVAARIICYAQQGKFAFTNASRPYVGKVEEDAHCKACCPTWAAPPPPPDHTVTWIQARQKQCKWDSNHNRVLQTFKRGVKLGVDDKIPYELVASNVDCFVDGNFDEWRGGSGNKHHLTAQTCFYLCPKGFVVSAVDLNCYCTGLEHSHHVLHLPSNPASPQPPKMPCA